MTTVKNTYTPDPFWTRFRRWARVETLGTHVLLAAVMLFVFIPLIWMVGTTFKDRLEFSTNSAAIIPRYFSLVNYQYMFTAIENLPIYMRNSFVVTLSTLVGQLITASLAGYAFARLDFPGKTVLFWLVMATIMIPLQATIIPVFVLISRMGLSDTLESLILPAIPTAFGTFLLRQYFMQIPKDFEEVALVDGAGQFYIFLRVYLPLVAPGLAVLSVLAFNGTWNEFYRPLVFLVTDTNFTIPLGLNDLKGYMMTGSISVVLAGVVLSLIPVLIVYLFGQRYLMEGIMMGGLKG